MALRNVLIPTFPGHLTPATELAASIREHCGNELDIVLVIGAKERPAFEEMARRYSCRLLEIEDLLFRYTGKRIEAGPLLKLIHRFRYQAVKKLLGVASLDGNVLVVDSETVVTRDLKPLFDEGIPGTTVACSERPWTSMKPCLTAEVHDECCELLNQRQPYWFFESFNWLYSSDLTRELLEHLRAAHGTEWLFRQRDLFECQLYFQYAYSRGGSGYPFLSAHDILSIHFGPERAATLLRAIYNSPLDSFGVFEYLARFVSRAEYLGFISDPRVLRHFRLMRHEPYGFYDIVSAVREAAGGDPNYFGEASMHRRAFMDGKIAVLASGRFHHEEDAHNLRHFLRGVDCDLFLGLGAEAWPDAIVEEILKPCRVTRVDDAAALDRRTVVLQTADGMPEQWTKPERDIGSMAMFDKMAACWRAMTEHEAVQGKRYSVVVRVRPDIFSTSGLRDILWSVCENMGSPAGMFFAPDRFWSQGINDQLFFGLREEMGRLFDGLDGAAYARCDYRNPEYFLGSRVRSAGLAPVPFPFEYILTRGDQPDLDEVHTRLDRQGRHFWSSTIGLPPWKDAGAALDRSLANVRLKNGRLEPVILPSRHGADVDVLFARAEDGSRVMLLSEHKSPSIHLFPLPPGTRAIAPHMVAAGLLRAANGRAVQLERVDTASGRVELSLVTAHPGPPSIVLQLTAPPRSVLLTLARHSLFVAHRVYRRTRKRAGRIRRRARALWARLEFSRPWRRYSLRSGVQSR